MERCPKCRSSDITLYMGGQFGNYECKKCGYVGSLIIDDKKIDGKGREIIKDLKKYIKEK
jgi:Zn ribbon nucleic-acid-binding protein